eukprot:CAMPEP_0119414672 /NCGR_PEP_ID=MMETSP1335-20130426/7117_1 /TAXON_ID=259385 /ORGANISM="Chrysoculter rhomboideus, Strain RCC1486" /LENGTH=316 /DNA_ID=CAMNT_0007439559 /DNA_START=21 /DNA_END=973 /DNA_ORIENTATION=-
MATVENDARSWIDAHREIADMNQYWYSPATIDTIVRVLRARCIHGAREGTRGSTLDCAFVSTPSLFFVLTPQERAASRVLDYDRQLAGSDDCGYVFFDFNDPPDALPDELKGAFHAVVIDPPFITRDVWEKYARVARWLLAPEGGLIVASTVIENAPMMSELLDVRPNVYLPSIPHLPYQYALYTNFDAPELATPNAEIPLDPHELLRAQAEGLHIAETRAAEVPLAGAGPSYDFEAMIEKAMLGAVALHTDTIILSISQQHAAMLMAAPGLCQWNIAHSLAGMVTSAAGVGRRQAASGPASASGLQLPVWFHFQA